MLTVSKVTKIFNQGTINEKVALSHLELKLKSGDFVTIIGGNGAGKSTLLNVISGVYYVDGGSVEINETDISQQPEHKRAKYIGRVFQDPMMGTAADMTIEENIAMALRRGKKRSLGSGISSSQRQLIVEQLKMLDLGLENRLKTVAGLLSGGQRQAITLLMATIIKPDLLLLDEHTAALDPKTARKVLALTEKIVSEHKLTTMMVTHNMKDAIAYGNRIIMLNEGRIILDIPEDEKKNLKVEDLLSMFEKTSGQKIESDRMLLA